MKVRRPHGQPARIICRLAGLLSDRKRGPATENKGGNDPGL